MPGSRLRRLTRRRVLLLVVAALLSASALLAVAILLIGEFGTVQGRILGTTAVLGAYGLLALPAAMLLDLGRARGLAGALLALCALGAALVVVLIWTGDPPAALGRTAGTVAAAGVAVAQTAILAARRRETDPRVVGLLFVVATALAGLAATVFSGLLWTAGGGGDRVGRLLGALLVLDLLAVALGPILARARAAGVRVRMRLLAATGVIGEVSAEGRDPAAAVAAGIRRAETDGARVVAVEILERGPAPPG